MKARKIGLDPDAPLGESLLEILSVRLDELRSFVPAALEPAGTEAQHDMRIAAKRVRYVLEAAEPLGGTEITRALKSMKRLQELLGEIHDCDELLPAVRDHTERLRAADAAAVRHDAGEADDIDASAARSAPNRARYRGLESLGTYLRARRAVLHARFLREWGELERRDAWPRLLEDLHAAVARNGPEPER